MEVKKMKIVDIEVYRSLWRTLRNNPENYSIEIIIDCSKKDLEELYLKNLDLINEVLQEVKGN